MKEARQFYFEQRTNALFSILYILNLHRSRNLKDVSAELIHKLCQAGLVKNLTESIRRNLNWEDDFKLALQDFNREQLLVKVQIEQILMLKTLFSIMQHYHQEIKPEDQVSLLSLLQMMSFSGQCSLDRRRWEQSLNSEVL